MKGGGGEDVLIKRQALVTMGFLLTSTKDSWGIL